MLAISPVGWFFRGSFIRQVDEQRLQQGLVLILPGIEGRSFLNISILQGLLDARVPYALEIADWTTGNKFLALYHLRAWRRNVRQAQQLAQRIIEYQAMYPGRPVWLIGHSGGAAVALLTLQALPAGTRITGAILLCAAMSTRFPVDSVIPKIEQGLWSYSSYLDCLFVGIGTSVFGTMDGVHAPGAGMVGFPPLATAGFYQIPYHPRLIQQFNLGGHFGCVHRVFIAETIAPLLKTSFTAADALSR